MKSNIKIIFLVFLLIFPLVHAQENLINDSVLLSLDKKADMQTKTNQVLNQQITVPQNLEIIVKIFFGLNNNSPLTFQQLIILFCIAFTFLLLIRNMVDIFPMFKGIKSWAVSLIVIILAGISGGLKLITGWIISIGYLFGLFKNWGVARITISIAILFGIFYLLSKGIKIFKNRSKEDAMARAGENIKTASDIGKAEIESIKTRMQKSRREDNIEFWG